MFYFVCPVRPNGLATIDGGIAVSDKIAKDCLKVYYNTESDAMRVAQELAVKHPTVQFAVMEPSMVFETLTPKVIRKRITDSGEIVVDKAEEEPT